MSSTERLRSGSRRPPSKHLRPASSVSLAERVTVNRMASGGIWWDVGVYAGWSYGFGVVLKWRLGDNVRKWSS